MSVKLIYHKDGKEIPIKMSIWDALRGAPKPRPRLQHENTKCPCCDQIHDSKKPVSESNPPVKGTNMDKSKKDRSGDQEIYTAEDDKKIRTMKRDDKSWKEILEALGKKDLGSLKGHWRTLQQVAQQEPVKDNQLSKKQKKLEKHKRKEETTSKGNGPNDSAKLNPKNVKQNKDRNGNESSNNLPTDGHERRKWLGVVSRYYDKTGQRISVDTAKKMVKDGVLVVR